RLAYAVVVGILPDSQTTTFFAVDTAIAVIIQGTKSFVAIPPENPEGAWSKELETRSDAPACDIVYEPARIRRRPVLIDSLPIAVQVEADAGSFHHVLLFEIRFKCDHYWGYRSEHFTDVFFFLIDIGYFLRILCGIQKFQQVTRRLVYNRRTTESTAGVLF